MGIRASDVTIHEELTVIELGGFKPAEEGEDGYECGGIDLPGSANWFCEQYGMSGEELEGRGILWTDYDTGGDDPWGFTILVRDDEVDAIKSLAAEAGYAIGKIDPVEVPVQYGDGGGTVAICRHPDGWVILKN